ncbi:vanadium-dependent haloperoxidase [Paenibacillus sedimenti]|uniref:Vanadium-dependent haloperoxidase n=1 Tax=Paenibacillus sedimenti TaxID=2770274 RepID=A0A926KN55_9BACL|nr:vanadium-dependent haloperoxidase [Paenibacillus sedimenti]MBD0380912.1 vanadium-dependent haloperoxidase [Paenibacillus sedimenti]
MKSCEIGPLTPARRRNKAFRIRLQRAIFQKNRLLPGHPCNGDESRYPQKIAVFTKGLPHNKLGEVDLKAYGAFIHALKTGDMEDFEDIPLGGLLKLVDPQAAYAFELAGPDSHQLAIAAPPAFSSAEMAGEMVELYWRALTRDIPFQAYENNPLTLAAASEISNLSTFRGPKIDGRVTTGTLFRDDIPGDGVGPMISQFLWKDIPYGGTKIAQRNRTTVADDNHLTLYREWLNIQNGLAPLTANVYDPIPRYIRNGRDLAEWVHTDYSYQSGLGACLILLSYGAEALDPANPYLNSATQAGFCTFGAPHILDFVARAARPALEAAWFQKYLVHRRIRPEEFGGRVHNQLRGAADYPINPELLHSQAVSEVFSRYGTYLLPCAYAEGCPAHPAYPSGHAAFVGAQVTMLKAFFKESFVIPDPVVASPDGLSLVPYSGRPLTIGGELNKLASRVCHGREYAGIHWRTDGKEGLKLGEAVAIGILREYKSTYNEPFKGFSLTKFDGTKITV